MISDTINAMWIFYALGASVLWGLTYVLNEQVYKKISIVTSIAITCGATLLVTIAIAYEKGFLKKDFTAISNSPQLLRLVIGQTIIFVLAEFFIALSISEKNATLAGMIEISYPVFIAFFAYLLYRENSITVSTFIGSVLIFSGIFIIYHFNQ